MAPDKTKAVGARLAAAKDMSRYKDETLAEFGKRFDVSYQSARNWLNGDKLPGCEHCIAICELLKISLDWLLLGRGEMRSGMIKGEVVYINAWPEPAKSVVRGMATMYAHGEGKESI